MARELKKIFSTKWFELVSEQTQESSDPHYFIQTDDYVSVVATTESGDFLIVSQYRAAVGCKTFELPSGHVDPGEDPLTAAKRELLEETGYECAQMEEIGSKLNPDTGRLSNQIWSFYAKNVIKTGSSWEKPKDLGVHIWTPDQLVENIRRGQFAHALNLTTLFYGVMEKKLKLPF